MTKQSGLYGLNEKIGGDLQGEPIFEMKTERLACRRANDRRVLQEQSAFRGGCLPPAFLPVVSRYEMRLAH